MKAVIFAAGEGKRMHPLTYTRPKAMLYTAGKPLLWHVLHEINKAGISEAIVVVKYKKEKITEYFKTNEFDELGMKIEFVEQGEKYGTAAALLAVEEHIENDFLAIASDIVTESGIIKKTIDAHEGEITVAAKRMENLTNYGVLEIKENKIIHVEEKPKNPKGNLANISIYVMNKDIFSKLKNITPSLRGEYELTDVLVGAKCVEVEGFWMDIAYPWHLFDAQDYLLQKMIYEKKNDRSNGKIENSTVKGKLIMEKGALIFDSCIDDGINYIGEGTQIGPHAYLRGNNSIGRNCSIGESVTIKNSVLFDNVKAKHLAYIGDSIIGEGVNFGAGSLIANFRFDEIAISVLTAQGWISTERKKFGAIIGDRTKFGILSCVMPGKTIGYGCWIGSGVNVDINIGNEKKVFVKQEKNIQ